MNQQELAAEQRLDPDEGLLKSRKMCSQSEEEARERLMEIFSSFPTDGLPQKDLPVGEVLNLLKTHGQLACELYPENTARCWARLPLSFFLQARVSLPEIREVARLMAIPRRHSGYVSIYEYCGVWDALRHGAEEGVLRFLLREFRPALNPANFCRGPPLGTAIESLLLTNPAQTDEEKIRVMNIFLDTCPEVLFAGFDDDLDLGDDSILTRALAGDFGSSVMHLLFRGCCRHLHQKYKEGVRLVMRREGLAISLDQAVALSLLLPCLVEIDWIGQAWSVEGLVYVLCQIASNTTVKRLELDLKSEFFEGNGEVEQALRNALAKNCTLSELCLEPPACTDSMFDDTSCRAVAAALASNSTIDSLSVSFFSLSNSSVLTSFLSTCRVRNVQLDMDVQGPWHSCKFDSNCQIESLAIQESDLSSDALSGLVAQFHEIPRLRQVTLQHEGEAEDGSLVPTKLTLPLRRSLGSHTTMLHKLHLENVIIDVDVLVQVLLNLKHLEVLKLKHVNPYSYKATVACVVNHLEHHSAAITTCELIDHCGTTFDRAIFEDLMKIKYYVALNKDGRRAQICQQDVTPEAFVGLLSNVLTDNPDPSIKDILECRGGGYEHNLQYGLLKTNPHLWSRS